MYYFLDYHEQVIESKDFYCITLLYINAKDHIHTVSRVYTIKDINTKEYLDKLKLFDSTISSRIEYKVKRDGKVGLSFKSQN